MEIGSRRILHINVTDHPTAEWTIPQFREFLAYDHPYRFVIHDRDSILSTAVYQALKDCGVRALKTPVRTRESRLENWTMYSPGGRSGISYVPCDVVCVSR